MTYSRGSREKEELMYGAPGHSARDLPLVMTTIRIIRYLLQYIQLA